MRLSRLAAFIGVAAFLAAGCGDDAPGGTNTNHNGNFNQNCPPALAIQGATQVQLMVNAQVDLAVRVTDCESQPLSGTIVTYTVDGSAGGAVLSVASAVTSGDGLASVTLTAGDSDATFHVTASTPGAVAVVWDITVTTDPIGLISVNMSYTGDKVFDQFDSYLFQDHACASVDPFNIQGAAMGAAPVATLSAHPQFPGVPVGSNYSVAVVASFGGEVIGFGCVDALNVTAGQITEADVVIADLPVRFDGLYYLDNHFDLTGALPPSVASVLRILDEMTDDHDLDGNATTDQWGLDPAAFLLDFVFRQFCCWTADDTDPNQTGIQADWDSCSAQSFKHDYGDLEVLYQEDFQSWDGAQPRVTGSCGILDQAISGQDLNRYAQDYVQGYIDDYVPDFVTNLLQMVGDLARVFTQMHIYSELNVSDIYLHKQGNFTHELKTLVVELHDQNGTLHTFLVDLASAGMSNTSYSGSTEATDVTLTIPTHSFTLELGKLVQYVYLNYLLPLFGVTDTAGLLAQWIDCSVVGAWLYDQINSISGTLGGLITSADVVGYCNSGLQAAGNYIDTSMDDWISAAADFQLSGTCDGDEVDADRVAQSLVNGAWNGVITENSFTASFSGTFTGSRNPPAQP